MDTQYKSNKSTSRISNFSLILAQDLHKLLIHAESVFVSEFAFSESSFVSLVPKWLKSKIIDIANDEIFD